MSRWIKSLAKQVLAGKVSQKKPLTRTASDSKRLTKTATRGPKTVCTIEPAKILGGYVVPGFASVISGNRIVALAHRQENDRVKVIDGKLPAGIHRQALRLATAS